jgi:hypothetical protein
MPPEPEPLEPLFPPEPPLPLPARPVLLLPRVFSMSVMFSSP